MKISAGILFVYQGKALVAHSTNSKWYGSYGPPKGGVEKSESEKVAACRETLEEIGITYYPDKLDKKVTVEYKNTRGTIVRKIVHMFICEISDLSEIGLSSEIVPKEQLQLEEVDDARFMSPDEIEKRAMPVFKEHILSILKSYR